MNIFHRHDWQAVAAKPQERVTYYPGSKLETSFTEQVTRILQRCSDPECLHYRTIVLEGTWTEEELGRRL